MTTLLRIVYCSRNRVIGSRAEIEMRIRNILAAARTKNKALHLTGAMTFNDSCFVQVLEGCPSDLLPLYDRIRHDPRHCDLKILAKSLTAHRLFPMWSMAYVETPRDDGRHPLAHFSFEAALTRGAEPEAETLLDAMLRLTKKMAHPPEIRPLGAVRNLTDERPLPAAPDRNWMLADGDVGPC